MKKFLCVLLSAIMLMGLCLCASAEETGLKFNEDGTFKILMMNDLQDTGNGKRETASFINAALDAENPDLVVFVGDQLSDVYPFASAADFEKAIANYIKPLEERNIPFLVTLGNHDHDREATLDAAGQYAIYTSYSNCLAVMNGPDEFTYNVPVMSSDGTKTAFNIYMMDTNNKAANGSGYAGINAEQLQWYKDASNALKAQNGGNAVPSLLFQHVPVKEIYSFFKEASYNDENAVYSRRTKQWIVLDSEKVTAGVLGEAPCSEDMDNITGQYQAWVEQGDIMGAFFAHDHVNSFYGTTEDGITMGYNGGSGFRSYGNGSNRSMKVFELNENDITNYGIREITYGEVTADASFFSLADIFSPTLLTFFMRIVYKCFGWAM